MSKFTNHNNPTFDFYMPDEADSISRRKYPPPFDSNHFDLYFKKLSFLKGSLGFHMVS